MNKIVKTLIFTLLVIFLIGCGGDSLEKPKSLSLKDGELIADFPASLIKEDLIKKRVIDSNQTVFGFRAYKIYYTTLDDEGKELNASGVVIIPTSLGTNKETNEKLIKINSTGLSIVLNNHGTIFANKEAPSVNIASSMMPSGAGVIYTSLGAFITIEPDYIGFGNSKEHYHPYLIKKSSAKDNVYFYKAALNFIKENNLVKLNNEFFLSGYSQGGYVALAALKDFEKDGIKVNIATPMAGPYLLDPIARGVLSLDTIEAPSFMADIVYSYSKRYKDIKLEDIINEPYASKLSRLFDSKLYTREEIDKELTTKVKGDGGLFTNNIVENYSISLFRLRLLENSLISYAPSTPIKLIHCKSDDIIPYAISENEELILNTLGSNSVSLIPVEDTLGLNQQLGHVGCASYAYMISNKIFIDYRKATIGY